MHTLYTVDWGAGAVAPQEGAVQISRMKRRKISHNTVIVNNTYTKKEINKKMEKKTVMKEVFHQAPPNSSTSVQ